MDHKALTQRSISRIDYILPKIKRIWHYYPQLTLTELIFEIVLAANEVTSDFSQTSVVDIEDVAYPVGHFLHQSRSLEMGIAALEEHNRNTPLPPVPIQTALLDKFGDVWRNKPQMRLGQILSNNQLMAKLKA